MFEDTNRISGVLGDDGNDECEGGGARGIVARWEQMKEDNGKVFLPRGSAESRFAPRQYYYLASKSGGMPGWAAALQDPARLIPSPEEFDSSAIHKSAGL
jgi:hypothetical protein